MRTITVSVTKEEYDKHIEREAKRAERERKRAEKAARVPKPPRKRKPKQLLLLQGDSSDVSTVQRGGTR